MNETRPDLAPPPWRKALPRLALRLCVIVAAVLLIRGIYMAFHAWVDTLDVGAQASAMIWLIALGLVAYALLIAVPFVPAVELGIALMVMEGPNVAPFVYAATIIGLYFAFWIGERVSLDWLHRLFRDLHMIKACMLLDTIQKEPRGKRLAQLEDRLPRWLAPFATRYRYVTIAVLLSVPGNFAIGGGGGIMMVAGVSRFFTGGKMFLTLVIAVLPIPLLVWVFGVDFFS